MPKLVDYGSRFAFLREAAFEVVLERGIGALSRQSVASAQGVSTSTVRRLVAADADLVVFAAEEVAARRRRGRWHLPGDTPRQRAIDRLCWLLPDTEDRVAEELVWWRIVFSSRVRTGVPPAPPGDGSLRERYRIAQRGYADAPPVVPDVDTRTTSPELVQLVDEREADVSAALTAVADFLEVRGPLRERWIADLRLLIDGASVAVCTGRLGTTEAVRAIERAVDLVHTDD